jgi:hypothetical protein
LPEEIRRVLPANLRGARDLHDLFELPGGKDWWKLEGTGREMVFTLDEQSRSMRRLIAYLEEREGRQ